MDNGELEKIHKQLLDLEWRVKCRIYLRKAEEFQGRSRAWPSLVQALHQCLWFRSNLCPSQALITNLGKIEKHLKTICQVKQIKIICNL